MGRRVTDDHFLLLFNAHNEPIRFTLPSKSFGNDWRLRLDTATGAVDPAVRSPGGPGPSTWSRRTRWWCCPPRWSLRPNAPPPEQRAEQAMPLAAKESAHTG